MLQEVLVKTKEGYKIKEICIDDDIFSGKEIENMSVKYDSKENLYYVRVELIYKEILYAQTNNVSWIILEED